MKLDLRKDIDRPIYLQIVDQLLKKIRSGELASGEKLPTERELRAEYRISAGTVKAAYNTLSRLKKVVSVQGSGTYVTRLQTELEMRHLRTEMDQMLHRAFTAEISEKQIRRMLDQEIARFQQKTPKVRVAWVYLCQEMLPIAQAELAAMPLVQLSCFKMEKVLEDPSVLEDNFDLIMTTERFYATLCDLVPEQRDCVYQTSLTMSRESFYQLSRIDYREPVLIWCLDKNFEQAILNRMAAFHDPDMYLSLTGGEPEPADLLRCPTLIVPSKAILAGHDKMLAQIQAAGQSGVKVIYVGYEFDRGSVLFVHTLVRNAWSDKTRNGFSDPEGNPDYHRMEYRSDLEDEL